MRAALRSSGSSPAPSHGAPRGRHRFVQDGEVPVTVLHPRNRGLDEGRAAVSDLERALASERDAHAAAEKALQQAEETIRQLQTRLVHAEMSLAELAAPPAPPPVREDPATENAQPAPKRTRRRHVADADAAAAVDEVAAGPEDEPVEWWRPGWRERLRQSR